MCGSAHAQQWDISALFQGLTSWGLYASRKRPSWASNLARTAIAITGRIARCVQPMLMKFLRFRPRRSCCRVCPAGDRRGIVPIGPLAKIRFTGGCCNSPQEAAMKLPINILPGLRIRRSAFLVGAACAALGLAAPLALAQANKPIRIGVPTAMQLQVGRDTQDADQDGDRRHQRQGRRARPQARNGGRRRNRESRDRHQRHQEADRRRKGRRSDRRLYQRRHAGATAAHLGGQDHLPRRRRGLAVDQGQGQDRLRQLQVHLPRRPAQRGDQAAPAHRLHLDLRQGRTRHQQDRHRRRKRQVGAGPGAAAEEGRHRRRRRRAH